MLDRRFSHRKINRRGLCSPLEVFSPDALVIRICCRNYEAPRKNLPSPQNPKQPSKPRRRKAVRGGLAFKWAVLALMIEKQELPDVLRLVIQKMLCEAGNYFQVFFAHTWG